MQIMRGVLRMTTKAAENLYLAQHLYSSDDKGYVIYNPHRKPVSQLPIIYGFYNGGRLGWHYAQLIAEDGTPLGSHLCSDEWYMRHDLGIMEGSRPDRHENFKNHYPDGYRMDFVGSEESNTHQGLKNAISNNSLLVEG